MKNTVKIGLMMVLVAHYSAEAADFEESRTVLGDDGTRAVSLFSSVPANSNGELVNNQPIVVGVCGRQVVSLGDNQPRTEALSNRNLAAGAAVAASLGTAFALYNLQYLNEKIESLRKKAESRKLKAKI